MIDTHCHILPFIDDGAADWDASLAMARAASADGIQACIATPHWTGEPGEHEQVAARLGELRDRLRSARIPLEVSAGNEVVLVPRLMDALRAGTANTLAGSNYLLLETAQLEQGPFVKEALFQLQSHGFRVILAHPERVRTWQSRFDEVRELISRGCFLQVTGGSLLGDFGGAARRAADELLRRGWVSVVASDAHSPNHRPQLLAKARSRCVELVGEGAARALFEENPRRILENAQLPYPDPDARPTRRGFRWPWSRG
ncbi:MAG: tyrosine-protein phosphatase [Armatimonadota bacterium]